MRSLLKPLKTVCAFALFATLPAVATAETFSLQVAELDHGRFRNEQVFSGFGCHGENVSPRISWSNVPAGTRSIVVTIHDPDAPTGGLGWTHWTVVNIPASQTSLEKGASGNTQRLPAGVTETLTDFGESKYGGPCPPQGKPHRYVVTAYALDVPHIDVSPASSPALVAFQMHGKIIAHARYVATYQSAAN
ncbi:YbhB/YbcL family Raf kinase inhibitor-like protein [Paraburkholderia sp. EG287A]|uniref:YbhB/YbcL family Raf kinase inhibitor-like protein n=1 Tax=unclassified Paraburkholderia TaxID=2615204 RepID=UPI0034D2EA94